MSYVPYHHIFKMNICGDTTPYILLVTIGLHTYFTLIQMSH